MKVRLKLKTTDDQFKSIKENYLNRIHRITLGEVQKVGLDIVAEARLKRGQEVGGFNDQTGNLRSSIGYIVLYNGVQVDSNFAGELTGVAAGEQYAQEQATAYPKGYALIIVAGMEYATYVEDLGYDVISGSTMNAAKLMKQVQTNVTKAFK